MLISGRETFYRLNNIAPFIVLISCRLLEQAVAVKYPLLAVSKVLLHVALIVLLMISVSYRLFKTSVTNKKRL